jgi:hypothetical protein
MLIEDAAGAGWEKLLRHWIADPLSIELGVGRPPGSAVTSSGTDATSRATTCCRTSSPPPATCPQRSPTTRRSCGRPPRPPRSRRARPRRDVSEPALPGRDRPVRARLGRHDWEGARSSVHTGSAGTCFAAVAIQCDRGVARSRQAFLGQRDLPGHAVAIRGPAEA